jgi:hypothetical protein
MRRVPVLICVAAVLTLAMAGPASAAGGWTVQYPPNPAGSINSSLEAVSCAVASSCIAVGGYTDQASGNTLSLAEKWNGSNWVIQPTPNPSGSDLAVSEAVSCPVTTSCEAVGGYYTEVGGTQYLLAEGWNGTAWALQSTPALADGGELNGVSCPSASLCIAVGLAYTSNSGKNLAEEWNGTTWSEQTIPAGSDTLSAVSCPSVTYCVAVGGTNVDKPYALIWNGSTWKSVSIPAPADPLSGLAAVSCFSATACTATGSGISTAGHLQNLVERWNGTKWAIQTAPNRGNSSQLVAVSCPSATSCTAVGNSGGVSGVTLAEGWNGSTWTIESTPAPNGYSFPLAISCTAVTCTSAGEYFPNDGGTTDNLAYQLN